MVKKQTPPPTRRTQAERSDATRAALMAAGRKLFGSNGYGRTAREEIVADAGVTRGALQHHFADKQGLFQAVYEELEQQVVASTAKAAMERGHEHPLEMLRGGCHAYLDAMLDPAVQRICALDGPAVLPADVRAEIADRYALALVRDVVQSAMSRGEIKQAPLEPLTRMLLAGVMAAAQYVATAEDPKRARSDAGRTVDMLLSSLTP
ncbi:MAG TPA: TetR/AcrR family transcriptional regulator [Acidimicrobiales bacterium]|nr:TetR/AcrR family transcriptional regulator [Acidimicrobiales bacterium]